MIIIVKLKQVREYGVNMARFWKVIATPPTSTFTGSKAVCFFPEVCEALNVSVIPGPVAVVQQGHNTTLTCRVTQRRRPSSLLVVRWLFWLEAGQEQLIVRMNVRRAQVYGNYTRRFHQPKVSFFEEKEGETYNLLIFNVSMEDRGRYTCKVQEITKHHSRWRAFSNGTATTELRGKGIEALLKLDLFAGVPL